MCEREREREKHLGTRVSRLKILYNKTPFLEQRADNLMRYAETEMESMFRNLGRHFLML